MTATTPGPTRRGSSIVLLAVGLSLAMLASACGDRGAASAEVVRSSVARDSASAADAKTGARVTRTVAARLYRPFATESDGGNLAYSPTSIAIALGMVRGGAKGRSADQLDHFLGTEGVADLNRGLNGLDQNLGRRSGKVTDDKDQKDSIDLSVANSMWGQKEVHWKRPFLDLLARQYGTGMHITDYKNDPEASRKTINGWVDGETHDKIPELIQKGVINRDTRLTLVNALYLAAPWADPFDKAGSKPFTTADGKRVEAPMMRQTIGDGYRKGDGWQAVTIPYAGHKLAMTVLLPDAGSMDAVQSQVADGLLAELATPGDSGQGVALTMPAFDLDTRPDLTATLKHLGVIAPFETKTDFEPITTDPDASPLRLKAVVHQATVTVDDKGTVAAAATAAASERVSGLVVDKDLTVDRPFLYLITDQPTGAILFLGRVTNPTTS